MAYSPQKRSLIDFRFFGLVVILLTASWCLPACQAYSDIFVTNSSLICDVCFDDCVTLQVDQTLANDCQRGCRIFDSLNKASIFARFDDSISLARCQQSCSEAYANYDGKTSEKACSDGCISAQQEYQKVYASSLQWFHEVQSNMTFFETLLEVTGAIVFPSAVGVDAGQFIEEVPTGNKGKGKKLQVKQNPVTPANHKVDDQRDSVSKQPSLTQDWISQSAFILITLGLIMMMGVCCYCCIFFQIFRDNRHKEIDADLPPSYEQLITSGFLIIPNEPTGEIECAKNDESKNSHFSPNSALLGAIPHLDARPDNPEVHLLIV